MKKYRYCYLDHHHPPPHHPHPHPNQCSYPAEAMWQLLFVSLFGLQMQMFSLQISAASFRDLDLLQQTKLEI